MSTCERKFISSSNMSEKLKALAREKPAHAEQLNQYADDLDIAVEAYVLDQRPAVLEKMIGELAYARRLYATVSGRLLLAD